jgi:hypothetical protein
MQKLLIPMLAASAALVTHATTLHYAVGGGSVLAQTTDPALVIQTTLDANLSSVAFNLDDGQSSSFPFFMIRTGESTVNTSDPLDDTHQYPISATLTFTEPVASAPNTGVTFGDIGPDVVIPFIGITVPGPGSGHVQWNVPANIVVGDRVFSVTLNDATFNTGFAFGGLDQSSPGALITATVTQISSNVPDGGATAGLIGIALGGMGLVGRRFRR